MNLTRIKSNIASIKTRIYRGQNSSLKFYRNKELIFSLKEGWFLPEKPKTTEGAESQLWKLKIYSEDANLNEIIPITTEYEVDGYFYTSTNYLDLRAETKGWIIELQSTSDPVNV